jgi:REDY-like protein HapK
MKQLIIMYNLKPGVTPQKFEEWVRTVDQPNMLSLGRVSRFRTFRTEGLLMGEGKPSVRYVEVFDITDLDGFVGEDMPGDIVQMVMGAFMGLVENPEFMIASEV